MFISADHYLPVELDYRREQISRDWRAANRRRHAKNRRRLLRLPKRPVRKLPERRPGGLAVA